MALHHRDQASLPHTLFIVCVTVCCRGVHRFAICCYTCVVERYTHVLQKNTQIVELQTDTQMCCRKILRLYSCRKIHRLYSCRQIHTCVVDRYTDVLQKDTQIVQYPLLPRRPIVRVSRSCVLHSARVCCSVLQCFAACFDTRKYSTQSLTPPIPSFPPPFLTTTGYIMDRTVGNTGGLVFVFCFFPRKHT